MTRTSRCNPDKLGQYAADGLVMADALVTHAGTLSEKLNALSRAGDSPYVPAMGSVAGDFGDLAGDWRHLEEFAGDVAEGFRQAASIGGEGSNQVFELPDSYIGQLGQVGYADRDEAIRAANAMAAELQRLRDRGREPTVEEVLALAAMAERGQYDPAFAVTFSEAVGVGGYNDATALIRQAYQRNGRVPPEGLAAVGVFAQTLTTALDTLPGIPRNRLHDPDNANLAWDQRLDADFVRELTSGYQPGYGPHSSRMGGQHPDEYPWATTTDLSVLLGMTDPPTEVAVDIANHRMTPELLARLEEKLLPTSAAAWGDHGGIVTNYAEMLGRNQDASALWLSSRGVNLDGEASPADNLTLVLQRHSDLFDLDNGKALAHVVENGLTNPNLPEVRGELMDQAIDDVVRLPEMRNEFMLDALASGVESNMDVIDRRINDTFFAVDANGRPVSPDDPNANFVFHEQFGLDDTGSTWQFRNTQLFLGKLLDDPDTAARVRGAATAYVNQQLQQLPIDVEGERPRGEMHDLGRILGVGREAEINGLVAEFRATASEEEKKQKLFDWALGWVPGAGPVNGTGDAFLDASLGDLAKHPPDNATLERELQKIAVDLEKHIRGLPVEGDDKDAVTSGVSEAANAY